MKLPPRLPDMQTAAFAVLALLYQEGRDSFEVTDEALRDVGAGFQLHLVRNPERNSVRITVIPCAPVRVFRERTIDDIPEGEYEIIKDNPPLPAPQKLLPPG